MGQNFHICLRSGPTGLTPPPFCQPDRKISVFFMTSLRLLAKCLSWVSHSAPFYKQNRRQKWSGKHGSYKQIWRTWKRHELDAQLWIYIHWEYTGGLNWGWLRPCMQELVTPFPSAYARPLLNSAWQAGDWVAPRVPRIRRLMGYQIPEKDISHHELNIPGPTQSQSDFHNPCKPDETSTSID